MPAPREQEETTPNPSQRDVDEKFNAIVSTPEMRQQDTEADEATRGTDTTQPASSIGEVEGREEASEQQENERKIYNSEAKNLMSAAGFSDEEIGFAFNHEGGVKSKSRIRGGLSSLLSKRLGIWIAGGLFSAGIAAIIVSFGLISNFKLEHIFQNIDQTSFARYNSAFSRRSDAWFRAYLTIRLSDFSDGKSGDSSWFRARHVDNNNPVRDWYKTLRTSNFEADLAKKGIVIESSYNHSTGKVEHALLKINVPGDKGDINKTVDFSELEGKDVRKGAIEKVLRENPDVIDGKLSQIFDSDKEARKAIKTLVDDETKSWQWFKRKGLRKSIQNMTGVRSWRFFETTRNTAAEKKDALKRKLISALVPETTKSGRFLNCLLGTGACNSSSDPADPANQANDVPADGNTRNSDENTDYVDNPDGTEKPQTKPTEGIPESSATGAVDEVLADEAAGAATKATLIRNIVSKFNAGVGYIQIADNIKRIHNNISNGTLSKIVIAAKTAQVIAAYTTYHTISDQSKSGEVARNLNITGNSVDEFNETMQGLNGFEQSEMYTAFFPSPTQSSFLSSPALAQSADSAGSSNQPSRSEYCADNHVPTNKDYAYLCADSKVGGNSNASKFEETYKNSVGKIIGPFVDAYSAIRDAPGIKQIADLGVGISNKISDLVGKVMKPVLDASGLSAKLSDVLQWITGKLLEIAGVGPGITANDPAGRKFNAIGQGAVASAESATRQYGGSKSTTTSATYLDQLYAQQQKEEMQSMPLTKRLFSLNNPDSLASQSLFAVNTSGGAGDMFASALNPAETISSALQNSVGVLFLGKSYAASPNTAPLAASGIKAFDIPTQCITPNPLTAFPTPESGTNADEVLGIKLDWATVSDSKKFWSAVYDSQKVKNSKNQDAITDNIYNCQLFDQEVRGSMAKGYEPVGTIDDVLTQNAASSGSSTAADNTGPLPTGVISIDQTGVTKNGGGIRVAKNLVPKLEAMIDAAAKDGVNLTGNGWRDTNQQIQLRIKHGCGGTLIYDKSCKGSPLTAVPGTSNHERGLAIDFSNCKTHATVCFQWLSKNAAQFGFFNLPKEPWHWSVDGK